jgi:hypothetical protein
MGATRDPEVEMIRRAAPFALPAAALALLVGTLVAGWGAGWSAALGVAVVALNGLASAWSVSRAARVSLMALHATVLGGFVIRMAVIVAIMFGLDQMAWFSPLAFGLAVVPATLLLLGYEMKLLAGGLGAELEIPPRMPTGGRLAP